MSAYCMELQALIYTFFNIIYLLLSHTVGLCLGRVYEAERQLKGFEQINYTPIPHVSTFIYAITQQMLSGL